MKKTYKTPAILIVKKRYRTHLLTGSGESRGFRGEISGYGEDNGGGFSQDNN